MIFWMKNLQSGKKLWQQSKFTPHPPSDTVPIPLSGSGRLGVGFGGGFMREAIMAHPNRVNKSKQQNFLKVKS